MVKYTFDQIANPEKYGLEMCDHSIQKVADKE